MNSNTAAFIIFLSLLDTQPFEVGARTRNSEMYILHTLIHYNKISFHINSILLLIQLHLYLYDLFTAYISLSFKVNAYSTALWQFKLQGECVFNCTYCQSGTVG